MKKEMKRKKGEERRRERERGKGAKGGVRAESRWLGCTDKRQEESSNEKGGKRRDLL